MTCEELRALLELEGTADSEAARQHLATCQACATEVERWQTVRAMLRDMGREPAPPFLHSRIMAHVRAEAPAANARAWLRGWRTPALAAVGAAVVILGLGLFRAVRPPAATPAEERAGRAEKGAWPVPAGPLDKGGSSPAVPAAPAPASAPAVHDETVANEHKGVRLMVPEAKVELTFAATAEVGKAQVHPPETEARQASADVAAPSVVAQAAPAKESLSRPEITAGAEAQTGREAAMAGTLRAAEQKREAAEVVRCRLQLEGDGEVLDLELPVAQAPPPHEVWSVMVASDGRIEVLDARGQTQQAPAVLQQGLSQQQHRQQQLRLGRYRLSQAPVQATPAP